MTQVFDYVMLIAFVRLFHDHHTCLKNESESTDSTMPLRNVSCGHANLETAIIA